MKRRAGLLLTIAVLASFFAIATSALAAVGAPTVRALPGSGRTATGVRINATVNSNGLPATYRFEWGTSAGYGNALPAAGTLNGGEGTTVVRYSKPISGLAPNTTIHYRVIANNAEGEAASDDQTVTTLGAERAYEMVSPPNKQGANLSFCCRVRANATGTKAVYISTGAFAGGVSNLQLNPYLSTRGATNWSTQFVPLPQTTVNGFFTNGSTEGFSQDESHVLQISFRALRPGAVEGSPNLYLRNLETGSLELVAAIAEPGYGTTIGDQRVFMGSTSDASKVFFSASEALTPGAAASGGNLYEFAGGQLTLASRLPDGSAANRPEGLVDFSGRLERNPVSEDGKRFFFVAFEATEVNGGERKALFMREGDETKLVSASHRAGDDPTVPHEITEAWASADGSAIYFIAVEPLAQGAPSAEEDPEQLYRYETDSGALTYIDPTADGPADTNFVTRILGVSADGSKALFSGGHSEPPFATFSFPHNRIFVAADGVSHFLAATDPAAQPAVDPGAVSANGRYLAIASAGTSFASAAANTCAACNQVYVLDSVAGTVECASCNPDGELTNAAILPQEAEQNAGGNFNRVLLDSGAVYFESPDRLVPEDINDKVDVYRFEHGQLDLVSTGHSDEDSHYGDVTADGSSAFFFTAEHLVSQDVDDAQDVYVSRVGGGLADQNPLSPPTPCFAEGCLDRSPDQPADVTPGSNGFVGPGNKKAAKQHHRKAKRGGHRKHRRRDGCDRSAAKRVHRKGSCK